MENKIVQSLNTKRSITGKRLYAAASMLLVSLLLLSYASYAWLVLSSSPEIANVTTNIAANGSLEIALGKNIGQSAVGDSFEKQETTKANRTWGNLIDLSDDSYGLHAITLRPVMLNSAGGAVNTLHPFSHPIYGSDGRVMKLYSNDMFAAPYNGNWFATVPNEYGVRGIGAAIYATQGEVDTFGPLSHRQRVYYEACDDIDSFGYYYNDYLNFFKCEYISLCSNTRNVLREYCNNNTEGSITDFDLGTFVKKVENVISAANEDLRLCFTLMAAAEMTPAENYHAVMALLEEENPDYETAQVLVSEAIQIMEATEVGAAIAELRAFQDAAAQLKAVIDSDKIDGSDGYSMEEIACTVGLIFDLEKSNFTTKTEIIEETSYSETGEPITVEKAYTVIYDDYYSAVIPELCYYSRYHGKYGGSSSFTRDSHSKLTNSLRTDTGNQDNASRAETVNDIKDSQMNAISNSLRLGDLDQAIATLYVDHLIYWDTHVEEYEHLQEEIAALEPQVRPFEAFIAEQQSALAAITAEIEALEQQLAATTELDAKAEIQEQLTQKQAQVESINNALAEPLAKATELANKEAQLQALREERVFAPDDSRFETIRSVMVDTIEAMRKYILWAIAYAACDGNVPDDGYHRMLEIANSSEYIHPRTAYLTLCNYDVTPPDELKRMVDAYEMLEKELLFLQREAVNAEGNETSGISDMVSWAEVDAELKRVFGTIDHEFHFFKEKYDSETKRYVTTHNRYYSPEDGVVPVKVMTDIREEIEALEKADGTYMRIYHDISYGEDQLWSHVLGLLQSISYQSFGYGESSYVLEDRTFWTQHYMPYSNDLSFNISVGVGSEENFNESGLTTRQTYFQKAQKNISRYQNELMTAALTMDKDMVALLMDLMAEEDSFSLATISNYLSALEEQVEYGEEIMYQAAMAMVASDYADDTVYNEVYSEYSYNTYDDAAALLALLRNKRFDEKVMEAFDHRMELLENQKSQLSRSMELLRSYYDEETGDLTTEQIPLAEAVALLNPVLDTSGLNLYGYVAEKQTQPEGSTEPLPPPVYLRTALYQGFGSPAVSISGKEATIEGSEPITLFGDVYLSFERSVSGALLALAKTQVETYAPPSGAINAEDIITYENGMNRHSYAMGGEENLFTLTLCTMDTPYALSTDLWTYTGNTDYISADYLLYELYGYCIDISVRTNAVDSGLLLQTEAANRIYDEELVLTDTTMGAGSNMEFVIADDPSYSLDMAKEYMSCIRVAIADTNTGYLYGYAALDMNTAEITEKDEALEISDTIIKAPLRLYDKNSGIMVDETDTQYLCDLEQNLEKNLTIYVYIDGAKASSEFTSAHDAKSLDGVLNIQFCSSASLEPIVMKDLR